MPAGFMGCFMISDQWIWTGWDDEMASHREILNLAVYAGEIMLKNGAEIDRTEETIGHILESFGIKEYNVFAISNAIIVSIGESGDQPSQALRVVLQSSIHLGRIAAVNEVSREIARGAYREPLELLRGRLGQCEALAPPPNWQMLLAGAVGCGGFCYLLGGDIPDCAASFLVGAILQVLLFCCNKINLSKYIVRILGSLLVTLAAAFFIFLGLGGSMNHVIIGGIMPLVPGVLITTAIRDFFKSNHISGTIHFIDAALIATCIAMGVVIGLTLSSGIMRWGL